MGTMELKPNRSAPTVVISLPYTSNGRMRSQTTSGRRGKEANQNQNRVRRDESKTTSWGRTSFPTEAVEPEAGTEADDISQMLKGEEGGEEVVMVERRERQPGLGNKFGRKEGSSKGSSQPSLSLVQSTIKMSSAPISSSSPAPVAPIPSEDIVARKVR
jgi:hypothetical protein